MLEDLRKKDKATFIGSLMYTLSCFSNLRVDFICSVKPTPRGKCFADELICSLFLPDDGPTYDELVSDVRKLCLDYYYPLFPSFIPVHGGKVVTFKFVF